MHCWLGKDGVILLIVGFKLIKGLARLTLFVAW